MNEMASAIANDLRLFSHELLERGLATPMVTRSAGYSGGGTTSQAVVKAVLRLSRMIPALLDEVDTVEGVAVEDIRTTSSPLRASPSRRPNDYASVAGTSRLVPIRWLQPTHREEPALQPLRWLLQVVAHLRIVVEQHLARLAKQVRDAEMARSGMTGYAVLDSERLAAMLEPLKRSEQLLAVATTQIRNRVGRQLAESERLPDPFPLAPIWRALRRDIEAFKNPRAALPELLRNVLADPTDIADLPFLYQRWCGLQLLRAFGRSGWLATGDTVGPLFLGGQIQLHRGARAIDLWVEPRLTAAKTAQIGCGPVGKAEWTPDYLIVTRTRAGRDTFVLDPTLGGAEAAAEKGKYLRLLVGAEQTHVAGVAVARKPVRSWACVPSAKGYCELADPEGKSGSIPMNPVQWRAEPLQAWVQDLLQFDAAWA